ncbi:MAG: tRNA pseudouridine(55) synthase TruB [Planctomycetota bacterium]
MSVFHQTLNGQAGRRDETSTSVRAAALGRQQANDFDFITTPGFDLDPRSIPTTYGFLCCNKPPGMTSRDLVNIAQGRFRSTKVGHAGTLDPLARGVLVLGVGPAARLVPYVQRSAKRYRAIFRLGWSSRSADLEEALTQQPHYSRPSLAQIRQAALAFIGEITQKPPDFSAVKIQGQRAYDLVRQGKAFDMPTRLVQVHSLEVVSFSCDHMELDITCGSGTYIRSLGVDLAGALGCDAVMTDLVRTEVGCFQLADAVSVCDLRGASIESRLRPLIEGMNDLPRVPLTPQGVAQLGFGQAIVATEADETQEAAAITPDGQLRAILHRAGTHWKPYRVFPVEMTP